MNTTTFLRDTLTDLRLVHSLSIRLEPNDMRRRLAIRDHARTCVLVLRTLR